MGIYLTITSIISIILVGIALCFEYEDGGGFINDFCEMLSEPEFTTTLIYIGLFLFAIEAFLLLLFVLWITEWRKAEKEKTEKISQIQEKLQNFSTLDIQHIEKYLNSIYEDTEKKKG